MKACVYLPQINCTIMARYGHVLARGLPLPPTRLYFLLPKADGRVVLPTAIQREVIQCSTINFKVDLQSPW